MEEKITKKRIEEAVAHIFRDQPNVDRKAVLSAYCKEDNTIKKYFGESMILCSDEECPNCVLIKNAISDTLSVFAREAVSSLKSIESSKMLIENKKDGKKK